MLVLTDTLTVGQITFVLRAAIQILGFGGIFLLSIIILSSAPRIASINTHDVINRVVGKETSTRSSVRWVFNYFRGKNADPVTPTRLIMAVSLFTFYGLFVSLSDVGFLGFYSCSVPFGDIYDVPLSVNSSDLALNTVTDSLVNGTNPANVRAFRCDSSTIVEFNANVSLHQCTSWRNSTYADPSLFAGINSTDSDMFMPRLMKNINNKVNFYLNTYYDGTAAFRVKATTLSRGIVVDPHPAGVRAVFGLPALGKERKAVLNKTFALEADMGCMTLGIYSSRNLDGTIMSELDEFDTNWKQNYTGPDSFRPILAKYGQQIRSYYRPLFNESTLLNGFISGNSSHGGYTELAEISSVVFPSQPGFNSSDGLNFAAQRAIMGNCTLDLMTELEIPRDPLLKTQVPMCSMISLAGSMIVDGGVYKGESNMICAAATQINMVAGTVELGKDGQLSLDIKRLPSDLHILQADYWDVQKTTNDSIFGEGTGWFTFEPVLRYTLSDNPNGRKNHYIPSFHATRIRNSGPGSGGTAISKTANFMIDPSVYSPGMEGITLLDEGLQSFRFTPEMVTRWGGQVGASQLLTSGNFNGWVAKNAQPILLSSTGGKSATCYHFPYAAGFIPLLAAAAVIMCWTVFLLFTSSLRGAKQVEQLYGGITPLRATVCPEWAGAKGTMGWQSYPEPHLELLQQGQPIVTDDRDGSVVRFLKTVPQSPGLKH